MVLYINVIDTRRKGKLGMGGFETTEKMIEQNTEYKGGVTLLRIESNQLSVHTVLHNIILENIYLKE